MSNFSFPFRGRPPSREAWVLRQEFRFSPGQWIRELPDPALWPQELDNLPETADGRCLIDRNTVFDVARRATAPLGASQALVAVAVWGTGMAARGRVRRLRVFEQLRERTYEQLALAINLLRSEGAVAAYTYLHGNNGNVIKHLGPSFGTKFLYFCGYDSAPGKSKPLILDSYVALALNRLCGLDWPGADFNVSQYRQYLELADVWARTWHTSSDVIERALFSIGKASPLAVSVLSGSECVI